MEHELAIAVAELHQAIEFIIELPRWNPKALIEKAAKKDPSYIEHIRAMEQPLPSALELWMDFGASTVSGMRDKYRHMWSDVTETYWNSDLAKKTNVKARLNAQIDQVLEKLLAL